MDTETLKERKQREEQREAQILRVLAGRKAALADAKREKKRKKKTTQELASLLALRGVYADILRPADSYIPRSHNLDRQLAGLINHMFVRYPVPDFLYQVMLADVAPEKKGAKPAAEDEHSRAKQTYRRWFVTLAQGGSFNKLVKGLMTSREAVLFLAAPPGGRVHENVWWARMKNADVPDALIGTLIERVFTDHLPGDPDGRLAEAVLFYARHHQALNRQSFDEVTDFVAHQLRRDPQFRMKGRTAASVVRLSNEWHLQMQRAKLGKHIRWAGLGLTDWIFEAKSEIWEVVELRDNKELVNEGRKQKHCVFSYVQRCAEGRSAIFSLRAYNRFGADHDADGKPVWDRAYETRRVTIEVNPARAIVQVRGPLNRPPTVEEKDVLRRWAGEKGVMMVSRP